MTALSVPRFAMAEQKRMVYTAFVEEGTKLDDVLKSDFWAHVAAKLSPMDEIIVLPDDMSFRAVLMVLDKGTAWAKVALIHNVEIGKVETTSPANPDYEVKLRGPHKWSIVRKSDNQVIRENIATREDANIALAEHLKALAA